MFRRILLMTTLALTGVSPAPAQETPPPLPVPTVTTASCPSYPQVTCTSTDALASTDALQLAADARDGLGSLLKLGPTWRFAVHIHILTPDDPLTA